MPIIRCYVDDHTLGILTEYGQRHGRTVEELAEAAISETALQSLPPRARQHVKNPGCADYGAPAFDET